MLARFGPIPTGPGWLFEPKLDGFRCLVCTHGGRFRARSRRGWDMTKLLPRLADALPVDVQLDGELVALDGDGVPDFHRLGSRMLHGVAGISVTLFVFDVLAVEGLPVISQPYQERRALLEQIVAENEQVRLAATFEDGQALFEAVCDRGLEGVVAKRLRDRYRPGERRWMNEDEEPCDAPVCGGACRRYSPRTSRVRQLERCHHRKSVVVVAAEIVGFDQADDAEPVVGVPELVANPPLRPASAASAARRPMRLRR
jgi:bifunctional non-homologous end joining protein LigD